MLPQELHLLLQLLGGFEKLNSYRKVSGIRIIIYGAILKLGSRSKGS